MKFLVFFTLILSIIVCSFASEWSGFFKDPAHPDKCVVQGLVLSDGEEAKTPGKCGRIICKKDSYAILQYCGLMHIDGCEFINYIDKDAPYPECCKEKICV